MSTSSRCTMKIISEIVSGEPKEVILSMRLMQIHYSAAYASGRFVVYSRFQDQNLVHIRDYVTMGTCACPSEDGVSFRVYQLVDLVRKFTEIDEQLKQQNDSTSYECHLGEGSYVRINSIHDSVVLCSYSDPVKNEISIPSSQWTSLKEKLNELINGWPERCAIKGCCSHPNNIRMMDCQECFPFSWIMKSLNEVYGTVLNCVR